MLDSVPENEVPFLTKDDEAGLTTRRDGQSRRTTRRLIITVALVSAVVSALSTVITHNLLPISSSRGPSRQELLPSLNVPPLGNLLRTYVGGGAYYDRDMNASREAWMSLFPRTLLCPLIAKADTNCASAGMGYVTMDSIKAAGDIPQIVQDMSTDGSGRFCVAAFHQLHCLVSLPTILTRKLLVLISSSVSHLRRLSPRLDR